MDEFHQFLQTYKDSNPALYEAVSSGYHLIMEAYRDIDYTYTITKAINIFTKNILAILTNPESSEYAYRYMHENGKIDTRIDIPGIDKIDLGMSISFDKANLITDGSGEYNPYTSSLTVLAPHNLEYYENYADGIIATEDEEDYDEDNEEETKLAMSKYYARLNGLIFEKVIVEVDDRLRHEIAHFLQIHSKNINHRLYDADNTNYRTSSIENDSRFHEIIHSILQKHYTELDGPLMPLVQTIYETIKEHYLEVYTATTPDDMMARISDIVRRLKAAKEYLISIGQDVSANNRKNLDKLFAYCYK